MRAAHLRGTEFLGMAGGALLVVGLFLPWYATDAANSHSEIDGRTGSLSGWDVHPILRWLLLGAASAPFVLAWIILRGHALSWARGEMTVVTSVAAFGLIAYNGFIDRPGEIEIDCASASSPRSSRRVMVGAAATRSSESERPRKPPGTI